MYQYCEQGEGNEPLVTPQGAGLPQAEKQRSNGQNGPDRMTVNLIVKTGQM